MYCCMFMPWALLFTYIISNVLLHVYATGTVAYISCVLLHVYAISTAAYIISCVLLHVYAMSTAAYTVYCMLCTAAYIFCAMLLFLILDFCHGTIALFHGHCCFICCMP